QATVVRVLVFPVVISSLCLVLIVLCVLFFFNDTATTEIYTLSLHDALPISFSPNFLALHGGAHPWHSLRSEEHTSELQSHLNLVCRLLLEKNTKFSAAR